LIFVQHFATFTNSSFNVAVAVVFVIVRVTVVVVVVVVVGGDTGLCAILSLPNAPTENTVPPMHSEGHHS
jgi:hypothetical protein